ncbi:MAG: hypothetical protein E7548_04030 [Ruminococcaceae bacterium]|nr:hypothetical protein [Oscillospiraceae bacterium]
MGEVSIAFVCALGIGTVFTGLICIVLLCKIIGFICGVRKPNKNEVISQQSNVAPAGNAKAVTANRGEIVAAISAAIAEELGTEVTGIRIVSIKKI